MVTLTCILEFTDGTRTSARVAAVTPEGSYPVEYRGAVHRLPRQVEVSDPRRLETFFQDLAQETGGRLQILRKGVYDFCGC